MREYAPDRSSVRITRANEGFSGVTGNLKSEFAWREEDCIRSVHPLFSNWEPQTDGTNGEWGALRLLCATKDDGYALSVRVIWLLMTVDLTSKM